MTHSDTIIDRLAAQAHPARLSAPARWMLALAGALMAAAVLLMITIGPRPGLAAALHDWRVIAKLAITGVVALCGVIALMPMFRPQDEPAPRLWLLAVPLGMLLAAGATEIILMPASRWYEITLGRDSLACLALVTGFSAVPAALLMQVLRRGAPTRPVLAGALAGLTGGGIGAFFYALHCNNDSPLYVAVWYGLGIAIVVLGGALAGHRLLRW